MKKWLIAGALFVCIVIGGGALYSRYHSDRTAPEISFEGTLKYTDGMTEEELLSDVSAVDEHDGDVSDSLIVESVTVNQAEQTAVVRYAARDSHNNVAKKSRTLSAGDGKDTGFEQNTEGMSSLPGDSNHGNTADVEKKTGFGSNVGTEKESETDTETESESESETETETETSAPGAPHIKLTENRVQIEVGDSFDPLLYVATVEDDYDNIYTLWRDIQLSGDYDVNTPGVYTLTYYVTDSSGNVSNHAKLRLTVKEKK